MYAYGEYEDFNNLYESNKLDDDVRRCECCGSRLIKGKEHYEIQGFNTQVDDWHCPKCN